MTLEEVFSQLGDLSEPQCPLSSMQGNRLHSPPLCEYSFPSKSLSLLLIYRGAVNLKVTCEWWMVDVKQGGLPTPFFRNNMIAMPWSFWETRQLVTVYPRDKSFPIPSYIYQPRKRIDPFSPSTKASICQHPCPCHCSKPCKKTNCFSLHTDYHSGWIGHRKSYENT